MLFGPDLPEGFQYQQAFITVEVEAELTEAIDGITFDEFSMRGVVARRRVAFFGETYERGKAKPLPAFMTPLRTALARWAEVEPEAFSMALVNEYRPGTPIGWHRDAPQYGIVAGVSLLSACRMRFRPYLRAGTGRDAGSRRSASHELMLERRSAYLMTGPSRSHYEHHIPPVGALRYSITFRTLR
jgi:alkylated DNA repair dioxygenase AlkB